MIQMKIPVDLRKIVEISDEIYTFTEVMDQIDLTKYIEIKESNIGRPRFESEKLMKIILFAFMEEGCVSTRKIEKLYKTDIRYIWMLDGIKAPSHMTIGVCDEYIAVVDAMQYASDSDCYIPLMKKFNDMYGFYPKYPIADAGYGSYNNYLFCESVGMEKFMKFSMFNKETTSASYREDSFRAVNFVRDEDGYMICPNHRRFYHIYDRPVRGNKFGRTEEVYQCEDCSDCVLKEKCHKAQENRKVTLNRELTAFHQEVIANLESVHGVLLRMNRSIQVEGAFGTIKYNRDYKRVLRRGLEAVILEFSLVSIGFNLHKFHLKRLKQLKAAA